LTVSLSKYYVSFVDIMFGVMIAESFTSFKNELFNPGFDLAVLLVAYFTIMTSWLFYHRSVQVLPEEKWERFALDVAILFAYFILITTHKDFDIIVKAYPILWVLYLLWDWLKAKEHKGKRVRVLWSVPYLFIFAGIALLHSWVTSVPQLIVSWASWMFPWTNWIELVALFATILVYRIMQPSP